MKKFRIIILSLIIFIGLFFALSYGYIQLFAKDHIISYLKKSVDPNASVEYITYAFPFGLSLKNVQLPAYGTVDELRIFAAPLSYLSQITKIQSLDLINPSFNIDDEKITSILSEHPKKLSGTKTSIEPSKTTYIHKINIQNGRLLFGQTNIKNLQGHLEGIPLPLTEKQIDFTLRAEIFTKGVWAKMQTHGWLNWNKKDMHAKLTLLQKETKNEIHASLEAVNNSLEVNGEMKITGPVNKSLTDTALVQSILQQSVDGDEATLHTNFSFTTQLTKPAIDKIKFSGKLTSSDESNATAVPQNQPSSE